MPPSEPLTLPAAPGQSAEERAGGQGGEEGSAALGARVLALIARRRRAGSGRPPVSPSAVNEELAVTLLYGGRSGSVTASPARPPR